MKLKLFALLTVAGMALLGCGSDQKTDSATDSTADDTTMTDTSSMTAPPDTLGKVDSLTTDTTAKPL